jgi:hypothetical protein
MRKVLLLALVGLMGLTLVGCSAIGFGFGASLEGSGNITSEQRQVGDFTRIDLSAVGEVVVTQGEIAGLTVETDDNLQGALKSDVRDGTLYLSIAPDTTIHRATRITFSVTVSELNALSLSGAGTIAARNLSGEQLTIRNSGIGSVTVSGNVREQDVIISGLGSYDGAALASQRATVELSGMGGAVVNVRDQLDVTLSGAGGVEYIGTPEVRQNVSGGGAVHQRPF